MNNLIPRQFENSQIRFIEDRGESKVVAKDVAEALGYVWHHNVIAHIPEEWKGSNRITTLGGQQEMLTLTEQGLYFFLGRSDKPKALPFQKWIAGDVMPTIRKTGSYTAPNAKPITKSTETLEATKLFKPFFQIAKMIGCDKSAAAISANQAVQKVAGTDLLALMGQTHLEAENQNTMYFTPTELGERIGVSARKLNLLLAEAGFQMKRGEVWEATETGKDFARIYDTGKRHGSGVPIQQIKWAATVLPLLKSATEEA